MTNHLIRGKLASDAKTVTTSTCAPAVRITLAARAGNSPIVAQYAYERGSDAAERAAAALRKGYVVQVQCTGLRISATGKAVVASGVSSMLCGVTDVVRFDTLAKKIHEKRLRKILGAPEPKRAKAAT